MEESFTLIQTWLDNCQIDSIKKLVDGLCIEPIHWSRTEKSFSGVTYDITSMQLVVAALSILGYTVEYIPLVNIVFDELAVISVYLDDSSNVKVAITNYLKK